MLPSIFGENLFDEFFSGPFDLMRMPALHDGRDQLYGKHARNIMKTDVREVGDNYEVDIDLPGFKRVWTRTSRTSRAVTSAGSGMWAPAAAASMWATCGRRTSPPGLRTAS